MSADKRKQLEAFAAEYPAVAQSNPVGITKVLGIIQGANQLPASAQR